MLNVGGIAMGENGKSSRNGGFSISMLVDLRV